MQSHVKVDLIWTFCGKTTKKAHKQWTYSGLMSSLYSYLSSPASTQASVEAREFSGEGGGSGFLLFVFVFYIEFALLHIFLYCPHQRQVSIDYRRSRVLRWGQHIDFPLKAGFALSRHSTPLPFAPAVEVCARLIGGCARAYFHQILCRQAIKLKDTKKADLLKFLSSPLWAEVKVKIYLESFPFLSHRLIHSFGIGSRFSVQLAL